MGEILVKYAYQLQDTFRNLAHELEHSLKRQRTDDTLQAKQPQAKAQPAAPTEAQAEAQNHQAVAEAVIKHINNSTPPLRANPIEPVASTDHASK